MPKDEPVNIRPTGTVSRLSLLVAFVAGAFAAWIFISVNENQVDEDAAYQASLPIASTTVPGRTKTVPVAVKPMVKPGVPIKPVAPLQPVPTGAGHTTMAPAKPH